MTSPYRAPSPLEITVGRGTPVYVHVSEKPQSKNKSLADSLTREQLKVGEEIVSAPRTMKDKAKEHPFHPPPCLTYKVPNKKPLHERTAQQDRVRFQSTYKVDSTDSSSHDTNPQMYPLAQLGSDENNHLKTDRGHIHVRGSGTESALPKVASFNEQVDRLTSDSSRMFQPRAETLIDNLHDGRSPPDDSSDVHFLPKDVKVRNPSLQDQIKDFENVNKSLRRMMEDLKISSDPGAMTQRKKLLSKVGELDMTRKKMEEQLKDADKKVVELTQQNERGTKAQQIDQAKILRLEDAVDSLEEQLRQKEKEIMRKDDDLNRLLLQNGNIASSVSSYKERLHRLEKSSREEIESLRTQLKETKTELKKCERGLHQGNAELVHRESKVQKLLSQAAEQEALIERLKERVSELDVRNSQLQGAVAESRETMAAIAEERNQLEQKHSSTSQMMRVYTEKEASMGSEIQSLRSTCAKHESLATEYKKQYEHLSIDLTQKSHELDDVKILLREMTNRAETQAIELKTLQANFDRVASENGVLTMKLAHQEGETKTLHAKLAEQSSQLEKVQSSFQNEKHRNEGELQEMKMLVSQRDTSISSLRNELEDLKRKMKGKEEDYIKHIKNTETLLNEARSDREKSETLRMSKERAHEEEISDLREKLDYANTQKRSLQNFVNYVQMSYTNTFSRSSTLPRPPPQPLHQQPFFAPIFNTSAHPAFDQAMPSMFPPQHPMSTLSHPAPFSSSSSSVLPQPSSLHVHPPSSSTLPAANVSLDEAANQKVSA